MAEADPAKAQAVGEDMRLLGLTWKVAAHRVKGSDTQVEVKVGRLLSSQQGGANDLVSLADVGFGASQVLPVVVALRVAQPGQLVHIEQPELHLHPNAQVKMGELLVAAANRGVRVIVETHSAVLIKAVQLAVALGTIPPGDVSLNWFTRDAEGATKVQRAMLDYTGAYGDWPVDFADVEMAVEGAFIDASFAAEGAGG
jgi:predicted ATPase